VNTYFLEFDDERSGGFASCEIGNKLTEEERWAKLRLVKEVAGTLIVSDHNTYQKNRQGHAKLPTHKDNISNYRSSSIEKATDSELFRVSGFSLKTRLHSGTIYVYKRNFP